MKHFGQHVIANLNAAKSVTGSIVGIFRSSNGVFYDVQPLDKPSLADRLFCIPAHKLLDCEPEAHVIAASAPAAIQLVKS